MMAIANRPTIHGRHFVAASGHPLATQAGVKILESGTYESFKKRKDTGIECFPTFANNLA